MSDSSNDPFRRRYPAPAGSAWRCRRRAACLPCALGLIAVLASPALGSAQTPAPASPVTPGASAATEAFETAPVVLDGETLMRVRGVSSFPARERARELSERIAAVARDASIPVSQLRAVDEQSWTRIHAAGRDVMLVLDLDARAEGMVRRQVLAEAYRIRIGKAIERYRYERSGAYLREQAVYAGLAILLMVAALLAVRWSFRRVAAAVDRRIQVRLAKLEAKSHRVLSAEQIRNAWLSGLHTLHWLTGLLVVFACLNYAFGLFPWTRPLARRGAELILDPLRTMWRGLVDAVPGLVFIVILIVFTRYGLRLARLFFDGIAAGRIRPAGFDPSWAWPTYRLVRFGVIAFTVVLAYPYIPGSSSEAFKGVSIFLGLLMSLGAASMVANSLAGYALIYRRAFKTGDRIKVGDIVGDVVEMRQQVTHLRTPKNEEVTIPSSTILGSHVVNYSSLAREQGLILHTTVGIGYETPWRQVEAMLIEAANRTGGLLREPPPFVLQLGLGDFCVTYEINVYCDRPQEMARLYTALHRNILDVFNEYGVQIMTPAYEGDPEQPKVVPKEQWYAEPAQPKSREP